MVHKGTIGSFFLLRFSSNIIGYLIQRLKMNEIYLPLKKSDRKSDDSQEIGYSLIATGIFIFLVSWKWFKLLILGLIIFGIIKTIQKLIISKNYRKNCPQNEQKSYVTEVFIERFKSQQTAKKDKMGDPVSNNNLDNFEIQKSPSSSIEVITCNHCGITLISELNSQYMQHGYIYCYSCGMKIQSCQSCGLNLEFDMKWILISTQFVYCCYCGSKNQL
ncbi:hypothetical protein NEF87_000935 [Candidatus Lokiarchaeum ossiferum]|uniref:Zinc ribbon domain-containing protein n=1 Tax=Candidatus Lokiarchaeum ossiferum TaxID=2951803 RepID=A0ABY6HMB2_9ARCH|nr:hypothetical protein NEF87_000935 [Candidatus Lokiarchaeum sp. B-35]